MSGWCRGRGRKVLIATVLPLIEEGGVLVLGRQAEKDEAERMQELVDTMVPKAAGY